MLVTAISFLMTSTFDDVIVLLICFFIESIFFTRISLKKLFVNFSNSKVLILISSLMTFSLIGVLWALETRKKSWLLETPSNNNENNLKHAVHLKNLNTRFKLCADQQRSGSLVGVLLFPFFFIALGLFFLTNKMLFASRFLFVLAAVMLLCSTIAAMSSNSSRFVRALNTEFSISDISKYVQRYRLLSHFLLLGFILIILHFYGNSNSDQNLHSSYVLHALGCFINLLYPFFFYKTFRCLSCLTQQRLTFVEYTTFSHCCSLVLLCVSFISCAWLLSGIKGASEKWGYSSGFIKLMPSNRLIVFLICLEYFTMLIFLLLIPPCFVYLLHITFHQWIDFDPWTVSLFLFILLIKLYFTHGRSWLTETSESPLHFLEKEIQKPMLLGSSKIGFLKITRFVILCFWGVSALLLSGITWVIQNRSPCCGTQLLIRKLYHLTCYCLFFPVIYCGDIGFLAFLICLCISLFFYVDVQRALVLANKDHYTSFVFNVCVTLAQKLEKFLCRFTDWRDSRGLTLTPLCLLLGIGFPIVAELIISLVASVPLDYIAICTGLFSVGLADAFASLVGFNFGHHCILGGPKTYEGLLAFFSCYIVLNYLAISICTRFVEPYSISRCASLFKILTTAAYAAVFEGVTNEVDNFLVPLFTLTSYHCLTSMLVLRQ